MGILNIKKLTSVVLLLLLLLASQIAHAGLFEDEDARKAILDLRLKESSLSKRIETLEKSLEDVNLQNSQLRRSLFVLQNQIDEQMKQAQILQGTNEKLIRDVSELLKRQNESSAVVERKLAEVDQRVSQFEPIKIQMDGMELLVDPKDKKDFDVAMTAFRAADFNKAERGFSNLVSNSPNSPLMPHFYYWLANSQYATGNFKEAAQNYKQMLARASNHPKAAEAMFGLANCLQELKDTKAVKKVLQDLIKNYPDSELVNNAKNRLKNMK